MEKRKSGRPFLVFLLVLTLAVLGGGLAAAYHFNGEIEALERSSVEAEAYFRIYSRQPFINPAVDAEPYRSYDPREDALYTYEAPEGFTLISHSEAWNQTMLEQLRRELLRNEHGDEINLLHEVIVYPYNEEESGVLASYTLGTKSMSVFFQFPAFPPDFSVRFPQDIGRINLYDGDAKTTIESMAGSLSHEYGHLYTFYYMFDLGPDDVSDSLAETTYAKFRQAVAYDLITSASPGAFYMQERHRYLFEIAAEDYVQLMGSPTTRQVVDFVDVQQIINGAQRPTETLGARNAFPQENMMIPLANDIPGLKDYFYSFIDKEPRAQAESRRDMTLNIRRNSVQHNNLESGQRTAVYYSLTWNTPYRNATYTIVCYDPDNYSGWGIPIKTVRPGQTASAVIGEYSVVRGDRVSFLDDGLASGTKVFYVVALLPDGTFHLSDKLEYQF